jgi:hypothetical protein
MPVRLARRRAVGQRRPIERPQYCHKGLAYGLRLQERRASAGKAAAVGCGDGVLGSFANEKLHDGQPKLHDAAAKSGCRTFIVRVDGNREGRHIRRLR